LVSCFIRFGKPYASHVIIYQCFFRNTLQLVDFVPLPLRIFSETFLITWSFTFVRYHVYILEIFRSLLTLICEDPLTTIGTIAYVQRTVYYRVIKCGCNRNSVHFRIMFFSYKRAFGYIPVIRHYSLLILAFDIHWFITTLWFVLANVLVTTYWHKLQHYHTLRASVFIGSVPLNIKVNLRVLL